MTNEHKIQTTLDIMQIKNQQLQVELENKKLIAENRRLELELYEHQADQKSFFYKIAKQVAHDINSPLSAFNTITSALENIPENQRQTLKQAAMRISDVTHDLLKQFRPSEPPESDSSKKLEVLLASLTLQNILSEKRIEFQEHPVSFDDDVEPQADFAYVRTNKISFECMLSNLMNNAVDAMEGKTGVVTATMRASEHQVFIEITDEGRGMSSEVREKIMNGIAVTCGRRNGHGIGMAQIRETLLLSGASMTIKSKLLVGTRIMLTFPRVRAPDWTTNILHLRPDQIILVLDDDPFIHGAWDAHFGPVLASHPQMTVKHFRQAKTLQDYYFDLPQAEQQRILLLSDYELIGQHTDGIEVIKKLKHKNSILVTSHFEEADLRRSAIAINIPVIPKTLANKMTIQITPFVVTQPVSVRSDRSGNKNDANAEPESGTKVDIIMLEDDPIFASAFQFRFMQKKIKHYLDPRDFLAECHKYPKDTIISIDNDFGPGIPMTGVEIAAKLNDLGFSRLYLVSGTYFYRNQLPSYLTFIEKLNVDYFDCL